ncbi:MAG: hypothetical protein E7619_09030 [Ruminococcaceae bacterium]|nr:hypothetical protein [Oscillospiraceae bacterium]
MALEALKNATGKKKGILIALLAVAALLLVAALLCLVLFLVDFFIPDRGEELANRFELYPVDYEYDISGDEKYMAEDRRVWVNDGTLSAPIDDNDYSDNQLYMFFEKYFKALQEGDASSLKECYSDELVKTLKLPYRISMQRVYDINLQYISTEAATDEAGIVYDSVVYRFEYKIMKNDGTFRRDLESDAVRPQYITIRQYFDKIYISNVVSNFIK